MRIAAFVVLFAIDGGIEEGDSVIVRGAERLAPGQPVEVLTDGDGQ